MMYWGIISGALLAMAITLLCAMPAIKRPVLSTIFRTVITTCGGLCSVIWGPLLFFVSLEYAHLLADDPMMIFIVHTCVFCSGLSLTIGGVGVLLKQVIGFSKDIQWALNYRKKHT